MANGWSVSLSDGLSLDLQTVLNWDNFRRAVFYDALLIKLVKFVAFCLMKIFIYLLWFYNYNFLCLNIKMLRFLLCFDHFVALIIHISNFDKYIFFHFNHILFNFSCTQSEYKIICSSYQYFNHCDFLSVYIYCF